MATLNLGRVRLHFRGNFADLDGETLLYYDCVTHAGSLWVKYTETPEVAFTADIGGTFPSRDSANWLKIASGMTFVGAWEANKIYHQGEVVKDGESSYVALQEIPSNRNRPNAEWGANTGYWYPLVEGIGNYQPDWNGSTGLGVGQFVHFQGTLWISVEPVAPGETPTTNPEKFDPISSGINPEGVWDAATYYDFRDAVQFHGNSYICVNEAGTNVQPINATTGVLEADWKLLTTGINFVGPLDVAAADGYYPGDAVSYTDKVWAVVTKTFTGETPDTDPAKFSLMITSGGAGDVYMSQLLDTDVSGVTDGSILQYEAGFWTARNVINTNVGALTLDAGSY